jgi:hypothetical protein
MHIQQPGTSSHYSSWPKQLSQLTIGKTDSYSEECTEIPDRVSQNTFVSVVSAAATAAAKKKFLIQN